MKKIKAKTAICLDYWSLPYLKNHQPQWFHQKHIASTVLAFKFFTY